MKELTILAEKARIYTLKVARPWWSVTMLRDNLPPTPGGVRRKD